MSNYGYLIAVPEKADKLRSAISEAYCRYTRWIKFKQIASFSINESRLLSAARYVEQNPLHAGITRDKSTYYWSSTNPHLLGKDDGLVNVKPLFELKTDVTFLKEGIGEEDIKTNKAA